MTSFWTAYRAAIRLVSMHSETARAVPMASLQGRRRRHVPLNLMKAEESENVTGKRLFPSHLFIYHLQHAGNENDRKQNFDIYTDVTSSKTQAF